ncbi:MAG TPA: hypothetical protein PKC86_01220 [Candidatus Saccharibacteria bacterium]|nr:hypothetical protein [Candidatus Saccharibacteria bacterium]
MEIPKTLIKYRFHLLILCLILFGIGWRLIPHIPNFAPIGAIAITAGMMLHWRKAVFIPLVIMIITDITIGLYSGFIWTWLSVAIIPLAGYLLRRLPQTWRISFGALGASLIFFIVSNFGVWVASGMYSHTLTGLIDCYVMALPFLRATLVSDLVFTATFITVFEYSATLLKTRTTHLLSVAKHA